MALELDYILHNYKWGKKGAESKVALLYEGVNRKFLIDNEENYAELWLGTHVNGPSKVKSTGRPLKKLIAEFPEYLGPLVVKRFGESLPFLFKVLSVGKALSIQAHPTKSHAVELHANQPDLYKDANHKPELAIALTPFEALCGFRPLTEIYAFFKTIPELRNVIGEEIMKKYHDGKSTDDVGLLKEAFKAVLTAPKDAVANELKALLERFKTLTEDERKAQMADLVERLYQQYPKDAGCFIAYFLNYLKLKPSEAIFLGPNEPHAYLSGDCIECMACSDNVVRAGLTPKLIDVETLCSMLTYKCEAPQEKLFKPVIENDHVQVFAPPVPDFAVAQVKVPKSVGSYKVDARPSASTLLVISGSAKLNGDIPITPGSAFFIPAKKSVELTDITEDILIYQGLANVFHKDLMIKKDDF